jgi:hypothetical protein
VNRGWAASDGDQGARRLAEEKRQEEEEDGGRAIVVEEREDRCRRIAEDGVEGLRETEEDGFIRLDLVIGEQRDGEGRGD